MIRIELARCTTVMPLNSQAMVSCMQVANAKQPFALLVCFPKSGDIVDQETTKPIEEGEE